MLLKRRRKQEEGEEDGRTAEGQNPRKAGVLQKFLLGADVMGLYLHAYHYRHDPSRLNLIKEGLARRKGRTEICPDRYK